MLITPRNAIHIVLARKTQDTKFKPYETAIQKWLFFISGGLLGVGAICAGAAYIWKDPNVTLASLIALLGSSLVAVAYQVASAIPEFVKLRNLEKEVSNPLLAQFNDDMDLINELSQVCEAHHLSYAAESFGLMAKHLRERISLLVGAIEKVGVIPLAITAYLSVSKAQKESLVAFSGAEWLLAAFIFLYLFALRLSSTAQWMEMVTRLYQQALTLKLKSGR